jgi:hypothetical protein
MRLEDQRHDWPRVAGGLMEEEKTFKPSSTRLSIVLGAARLV